MHFYCKLTRMNDIIENGRLNLIKFMNWLKYRTILTWNVCQKFFPFERIHCVVIDKSVALNGSYLTDAAIFTKTLNTDCLSNSDQNPGKRNNKRLEILQFCCLIYLLEIHLNTIRLYHNTLH